MTIQETIWGEEKELPEVQIFVPSAAAINAVSSSLNSEYLSDIIEMAAPFYKFAKQHRCYTIDKNGKKSYPAITEKVLSDMKMLKKDWINLYATLNHINNFHLFFNQMPKKQQELFHMVLCNHYVTEEKAEKILGIKDIIVESYYFWDHEVETIGSLKQWYSAISAKSSESSYTKGHFLKLKEEVMYTKFLPAFFPNMMNVPVRKQLTKEEKEGLTIYSEENTIFTILPIISSLYDSKQIVFGRSKVATAAVKKAAKMMNTKEFFPKGDKDTSILAASYLINNYSLYYCSNRRSKKNRPEPQDELRDIFRNNIIEEETIVPLLLPHITGFRKAMFECSNCYYLLEQIQDVLVRYSEQEWLEINQFCFLVRVISDEAEESYQPFSIPDLNKVDLYNQYSKHYIYLDNFFCELTLPLIKSFLFMMAAMGMVEIAYSEVSADDKKAVSCFDGLKYVRLTNLGKYALCLTDKYVRTKEQDVTYFELDSENLIIKSLVDANPYESLLGSLAEHISKKMYKVTPESFLKDCDSKKDIENRIAIFKDYVCDKPSANWSTFFKQMLDRCSPMIKPQKQYKLLQLPAENKELQRIVLSDPNIRKYILKAEDYHILVEQDNYKKFCDTLKKYGYLL